MLLDTFFFQLLGAAPFRDASACVSVFALSQTLEKEQGASLLQKRDERIDTQRSLQTKYREVQA